MHSGYEIPGIQQVAAENNTSCGAPVLLSMNQTHFLDQIHTLPATTQQRLFLDQPHFFPTPQSRLSHHYVGVGASSSSSAYFPAAVNFKLGLNEICARNINDYKHGIITVSSIINEEGDDHTNLLSRGSEQYHEVPEPEARHSSLGMLNCWQNQQDSAAPAPVNKQPPSFWEHLPSEVSNENSTDRSQEHLEMNQKEQVQPDNHLTTCLDSKNRLHFGELEAIYKRLGTTEGNQTGPCETNHLPVNAARLTDHGSDPEEAASASILKLTDDTKRKRKKKKKENSYNRRHGYLISPMAMADFFGNLVKQVMDHQENMHKKFTQVIERLEEERRVREEDWRKQELVRFEQESEARAKEKALAKNREAMIVSCLEKITGERIKFSNFDIPMEINIPTNTSYES